MNNVLKLVLPKTIVEVPQGSKVFFLAGPIRGANDWQHKAILRIAELVPEAFVVTPSRYTEEHPLYQYALPQNSQTLSEEEIVWTTESQTHWERYYLEIASRTGCILFWLPEEDKKKPRAKGDGPFAQDTYGELGEWRARLSQDQSLHLVIGAVEAFPGLRTIQRNYKAMVRDSFVFYSTLEDTIQAAVERSERL
jgi:hypothetical protein